MALIIDFAGEIQRIEVPSSSDRARFVFTVGRAGDLAIDESEYLHRRFLSFTHDGRLWWITNVGSRILAGMSIDDRDATWWLQPGQSQPIVFEQVDVQFSAGATTFDLQLRLEDEDPPIPPFDPILNPLTTASDATHKPVLTSGQRKVLVALIEPLLRSDGGLGGGGQRQIRTQHEAAKRISPTMKAGAIGTELDRICEHLRDQHRVDGLIGRDRQASLITFVLQQGLISAADLDLLD